MLGLGLDKLVDVLASLESRAIRVYPQQCSKLRHRRSSCSLCADWCPTQAITWEESLQVDPDKCTGCGICATVCPTGALEAHAPTNVELLGQIQALVKLGSTLAFACPRYLEARNGDRDRFIPVNCLGRLDESILVGSIFLGAEAVWLVDGACQECPYAAASSAYGSPSGKPGRGGRAVAAQVAERANELLQVCGTQGQIFIGPQLPGGLNTAARPRQAGETLSRRAFFSMLAHRTTGAAAIAATATIDSILGNQETQPQEDQRPKKGELSVYLPGKRRLLLAALRQMGKPAVADFEADGGPFGLAQGKLWAQFELKEGCTGCQMCAFFCPTGALNKIEEDGKAGVTFRISHCTNCRLCQDICYKEVVALSSDFELSKVLDDAVDTLLMRGANDAPWHVLGVENRKGFLGNQQVKNE
jgi:formate hydrogenlyase subunit 6/NADH:ubiquinone oxidoreductase subunit I